MNFLLKKCSSLYRVEEDLLKIQREYLQEVWRPPYGEVRVALPGHSKGGCLQYQAFGGLCELYPHKMGVRFIGYTDKDVSSGDFSFILFPLLSIRRHYVFYIPDEEFPAGLNCLFPANAIHFTPVAELADVAGYTARKIIQLMADLSLTPQGYFTFPPLFVI